MRFTFLNLILFLFLSIVCIQCKSGKQDKSIEQSSSTKDYLVFLNKEEAVKQINQDRTDGFFESLSIADMSIQLKQQEMPASGGESKLLYQELLKSEMQDFSEQEEAFMQVVFDSTLAALNAINPNLMPERIELIKTKTNHYGPNVYYTREDAIILPDNIFLSPSLDAQMPVMLHEIFHILSRYNVDFREQMYGLIGFVPFEEELVLPKKISDRLLTNPDGVSTKYAIKLKNESGIEQLALPLILSTKDRYEPSMPIFFSYLSFDLFPLIKIAENEVTLGLNSKGESSLSIEHNADFFKQIKDNTQYIIHPDEIMADNFMMAVIASKNGNFDGFSEDGKKLLMDVINILKTFK
ncbi:MAG: hypothetical protein P1U56_25605 [Saprospiraceae bacterium]|nr:hypothetical protein [Saprospiraceae bacterium]